MFVDIRAYLLHVPMENLIAMPLQLQKLILIDFVEAMLGHEILKHPIRYPGFLQMVDDGSGHKVHALYILHFRILPSIIKKYLRKGLAEPSFGSLRTLEELITGAGNVVEDLGHYRLWWRAACIVVLLKIRVKVISKHFDPVLTDFAVVR